MRKAVAGRCAIPQRPEIPAALKLVAWSSARALASSPRTPSALVGTSAGQDALDDDRPRSNIEPDDHAPIADPKTGLLAALQPPQVGSSRVFGESPDRAEHPLLDLRVESFEILLSTPFELNRPPLCGHGPPCLRMISA